MSKLKERYFNWMRELVSREKPYYKLCRFLDSIDFYYILDMDSNRYEDGIDLRYRFAYEEHYSQAEIASEIDNRPCSVFEMMVALALRCEDIVGNNEYGDRTYKWFFAMLDSLGIDNMTDSNFNERKVEHVIDSMMRRDYAKDGRGGLFTVTWRDEDMRDVEIWYQAMWYITAEEGENI